MPLKSHHIHQLKKSIANYSFPAVYFDFSANQQIVCHSMTQVEAAIRGLLTSSNLTKVKDGLSNVLYWGYANSGYRQYRMSKFRNAVAVHQLQQFSSIVANGAVPTLATMKSLKMPGFSGVSFLSKIAMFLSPATHCVLDLQIAKLANPCGSRALVALKINRTSIPATIHNQGVYDNWRGECKTISQQYYNGHYRSVDIERGFFCLLQSSQIAAAQNIYQIF